MKNLLLLLLLIASSPLLSQENKEATLAGRPLQKFSLGLLAGLNLSYMPYRPNADTEGGASNTRILLEQAFFAGVSARQPIAKQFAIKMDANFAVKGYGLKRTNLFLPIALRYQAIYLDIVPQLEFNVLENIYLSLGGYGGVRVAERIKHGQHDWIKIDATMAPFAKKTDLGLAAGFRAEFNRVSFLIKYQHGLTPAITLGISDGFDMRTEAEQFHHTLQIGLGFKIL